MNPVAQTVENAGLKLSGANGTSLDAQLNAALAEFLGWPYKIVSGQAADGNGGMAGPFASVVYVAHQTGDVDHTACAGAENR